MSSHIPPTQSVWAINDTVNNSVTIARGVLEAATSDNINPVALLSCEAFGNVLPLCVETRYKIERLARRNYTSHVLNFIKAQISYRKNDVVELLSNSDASVLFSVPCGYFLHYGPLRSCSPNRFAARSNAK